jgi:hypothetical protein
VVTWIHLENHEFVERPSTPQDGDILGGKQEAGMDVASILLVVICVASIPIIGDLAEGLGRKPSRWIWIAVLIGPFAIPLLGLAVGISAFGKMMKAPRPSN